jgi:hypothetical protein
LNAPLPTASNFPFHPADGSWYLRDECQLALDETH